MEFVMNQMPGSPLEHILTQRMLGATPRAVPGAAMRPSMPRIPKQPMMAMPRPRTFARPIASGLRPNAMMPNFVGKL